MFHWPEKSGHSDRTIHDIQDPSEAQRCQVAIPRIGVGFLLVDRSAQS
jgi:hypothetical protein